LQKSNKEVRPTTSENTKRQPPREAIKCYNCKEKGHRAAACPNPRIITSEPDKQSSDLELEKKTSNVLAETNLIQPFIGDEPYIVPVSYDIPDNEGNISKFSVKAIVDTGSPVSIIKPEYALVNCRTPVTKNSYQFNGVNNSRIEILGIFEKTVKINDVDIFIKFFVVPHKTMSGEALLGRDFTSNPPIKILIDETFKLLQNNSDSEKKQIILSIK